MSETKSFWTTLPGILTGIAGLITALGGLMVILYQIGVIAPKSSRTSDDIGREQARLEQQTNKFEQDRAKTEPKPIEPAIIRRGLYRSPIRRGARLYYYDFDKPEKYTNLTSAVDFSFKPDNISDKDTRIGVVPHNNARFSPRSLDLFPWEIDKSEFTSAKGIYSIPQNKNIPCITSDGTICTFKLWLEEDGEFVVSYILYELR